jgi:hypothetical protein
LPFKQYFGAFFNTTNALTMSFTSTEVVHIITFYEEITTFFVIRIVSTLPSYGDYVEFSSNDSICPAGFSVPTEGEFAAETTRFPQRGTNVATVLLSFLKLPADFSVSFNHYFITTLDPSKCT